MTIKNKLPRASKYMTDITQQPFFVGPDLVSGRELPVCHLRGRGQTQGQALQSNQSITNEL
jgi:hypothetical protein